MEEELKVFTSDLGPETLIYSPDKDRNYLLGRVVDTGVGIGVVAGHRRELLVSFGR